MLPPRIPTPGVPGGARTCPELPGGLRRLPDAKKGPQIAANCRRAENCPKILDSRGSGAKLGSCWSCWGVVPDKTSVPSAPRASPAPSLTLSSLSLTLLASRVGRCAPTGRTARVLLLPTVERCRFGAEEDHFSASIFLTFRVAPAALPETMPRRIALIRNVVQYAVDSRRFAYPHQPIQKRCPGELRRSGKRGRIQSHKGLGTLGGLLGKFRGHLESSWGGLGASWSIFGAILRRLGLS